MKIHMVDFDEQHYASNLQQSNDQLKWDSLGSTYHLLIRAEYGAAIKFTDFEQKEISKYSNELFFSENEVRYSNNRFFVVLRKGYVNKYQYTTSPASYAVFCCDYNPESDICTLYVPNDACMFRCNVSSIINVKVVKETNKKKLFAHLPEKQYYTVLIPVIPGYVDGSIHYTFNQCKYRYPITKSMLGKPISVPAYNSSPPEIVVSPGSGYKLR